jgi:hypothetical protein
MMPSAPPVFWWLLAHRPAFPGAADAVTRFFAREQRIGAVGVRPLRMAASSERRGGDVGYWSAVTSSPGAGRVDLRDQVGHPAHCDCPAPSGARFRRDVGRPRDAERLVQRLIGVRRPLRMWVA